MLQSTQAMHQQLPYWLSALNALAPLFSAIVALVVGAFAVYVGLRQYKIGDGKLRLDLYNRRFEIYARALDLYHELSAPYASEASRNNFQSVRRDFIKSYRESQFLFDPKDEVFEILGEMDSRSFKRTGYWDVATNLDPDQRLKMHQESEDAYRWIGDAIPKLEKRMERYLSFHNITA